ncbi:MAG: hypothetical protein K940chlam9_01973, partial [Chlamydiae bacterium]|nr:hypothetical protein [Chlamydiota bacterium]
MMAHKIQIAKVFCCDKKNDFGKWQEKVGEI